MSFAGSIYGRLTKDPEVKQSQSGSQYTMFSVAVNGGKNQDGSDRTTFVNVKAFGKQGETIAQSFRKGHRIKVDVNQVEASAWINQQSGQAQGGLNAVMTSFDFVETKAETGQQGAAPYGAPPQQPQAAYTPPQGYAPQPQMPPQPGPAPAPQPSYGPPQGAPQQQYMPPQQQAGYAPQPPQQPQTQNYANSPWG